MRASEEGEMVADAVLSVRRQPGDWRIAEYHWKDVRDLHWTSTSGGVRASLPHLYVHGYVMCDAMIRGELAHSCEHGPPPHEIRVCITKQLPGTPVVRVASACPRPGLEPAEPNEAALGTAQLDS
jgi:hypothetical protein